MLDILALQELPAEEDYLPLVRISSFSWSHCTNTK